MYRTGAVESDPNPFQFHQALVLARHPGCLGRPSAQHPIQIEPGRFPLGNPSHGQRLVRSRRRPRHWTRGRNLARRTGGKFRRPGSRKTHAHPGTIRQAAWIRANRSGPGPAAAERPKGHHHSHPSPGRTDAPPFRSLTLDSTLRPSNRPAVQGSREPNRVIPTDHATQFSLSAAPCHPLLQASCVMWASGHFMNSGFSWVVSTAMLVVMLQACDNDSSATPDPCPLCY